MRLSRPIIALLSILLMFAAPVSASDPFGDAARRLVAEIAAKAGNEITVSVRNRSSMSESQFASVRAVLEAQLRAQGLKLLPNAAAQAQITLAQSARGYLWVAEVRKGDAQQVAIEPVAREDAAPPLNALSFAVRKTLVWAQEAPILDVAQIKMNDAPRLLVLEPGRVALYAMQGARGELLEEQPIVRTTPPPRDLRGRLLFGQDHLFDAYVPGMHCGGPSVAAMTCAATDDPWPLDLNLKAFFAASRNFFTGVLSGDAARGRSTAPFYSAAKLDEQGAPVWLFAGVDGRMRWFDGAGETVLANPGWGSDLAAVRSVCGSGTQLLVTRLADDSAADTVRAFEMTGRQPVPVSEPLDFNGPITALWAAPGGAIAVSRNLNTGNYEAFNLTIACER